MNASKTQSYAMKVPRGLIRDEDRTDSENIWCSKEMQIVRICSFKSFCI